MGESKLFWEGGGEALRGKRTREWEEMGWEEWEMTKEMNEGDGGKMVEEGVDEKGRVGETEVLTLPVKSHPTKRAPLRGRRRGQLKGTVKEEAERLARSMTKWLSSNQRRE